MAKAGWGQRLRSIRGAATQEQWGPSIGIGRATWASYEAEKSYPDLRLLMQLQARFDVSIDWIITGQHSTSGLNFEVLRQVVQAVDDEVPKIDAESKAKLIVRLYTDRIKVLHKENEETQPKKGKAAS